MGNHIIKQKYSHRNDLFQNNFTLATYAGSCLFIIFLIPFFTKKICGGGSGSGECTPHHQQAILRIRAGYPRIQLNFDTLYLEIASDPIGKGIVPQDRSPPSNTHIYTSDPSHKSRLSITCTSNQLAIDQRFQISPPWI